MARSAGNGGIEEKPLCGDGVRLTCMGKSDLSADVFDDVITRDFVHPDGEDIAQAPLSVLNPIVREVSVLGGMGEVGVEHANKDSCNNAMTRPGCSALVEAADPAGEGAVEHAGDSMQEGAGGR